MSKHKISGYLYHVQYRWEDTFQVKFSSSDTMGDGNSWTMIGPYEIEVEVPDDFDPRPGKIEALRVQEQDVRAEFSAKLVEIEKRINELLALEMSVN